MKCLGYQVTDGELTQMVKESGDMINIPDSPEEQKGNVDVWMFLSKLTSKMMDSYN